MSAGLVQSINVTILNMCQFRSNMAITLEYTEQLQNKIVVHTLTECECRLISEMTYNSSSESSKRKRFQICFTILRNAST